MRRQLVLGVLLAMGTVSIGTAAWQAGPAPRVVEVDQIKDNLYMMRNGGGNSAVFIMADGVTVVDTKNPGWGQPLLEKIKSVTGKPIVRIINTHTHGDHVSGNVEFPATVEVVTHENTAKNMQEMKSPTGITPAPDAPVNIFKDNNGKGLPRRTFKDKMSIGKGADQIDLYYFGRGHTNGDAWVVFRALGVMHAGDIFSGKNIPLLDAVNGGSGVLIGDTLAKAAKDVKNVDRIITGHSTVMTVADLEEYAAFNTDFKNTVQAGKKAGQTVDQIAAAYKIPERFKGYAAPAEARLKNNVQIVWDETK
ncbi:MAG TPA: MBL fold metallo-hydrolase [Vicinamibacterales bacterium]|nr:MBL fold metallo-hydrolase [Vicinamibacterales bacterium]